MNVKIPRPVFYTTIAVVALVIGIFLYREATDPLYHRDPETVTGFQRMGTPGPPNR